MTETTNLAERCKKRDARAQRELYDLYKSRLMGLCRRYASSREEAQDVLQEAFIKIFTRFDQLEDTAKLEAWMRKITVNTAVNYYHRARRFVFNDIENVQAASGDYEVMMSNISDEYLVRTINSLPDGCRVIFNLFVVEGYNHSEIAEMLHITESTSRSQLVYAKGLLKQRLNSQGVLRYERYA
ncbi:MAG TPA: sigma-70 family RNA polymerase sigma factor [Chryseosolibacter sp.]|nr:sigma-70 family RNA polymerase sigma factor [Chryseosolibacter sp.]